MSPPRDPATAPARTSVQRGYATLVVALAAMLAAMVVLRVPFRGYLVEGRVSGCLDPEIAEADLGHFVKHAAAGLNSRIDVQPSGCCEVIFQQLSLRAGDAQAAINRASRQVADQFVAQRREAGRQVRLARYQAELRTARDAEESLRQRLDQLRQQQLAEARQSDPLPLAQPAFGAGSAAPGIRERLATQLVALQEELLRKLATMTDEHPEVITLRSRIAGLESELYDVEQRAAGPSPEQHALSAPPRNAAAHRLAAHQIERGLAEQLDSAAADLMASTRARQWAERQLQSQIQSLASISAAAWSIEPAQVTARVGGTPRMLTLLAAAVVTLLSGAVMFWATGALLRPAPIRTPDELASLLALPLVGHTPAPVSRLPRRWRRLAWKRASPLVVRIALHGAELFLVVMVGALVFTMLADRALASQVLIDPFGVLSEVADRVLPY